MNRYQTNSPRIAFGVCAGLLSIATIGAAVVAPAAMHFRSQEVPVMAVSTDTGAADTRMAAVEGEAAPVVTVVDVSAVREPHYVIVVEHAPKVIRRT